MADSPFSKLISSAVLLDPYWWVGTVPMLPGSIGVRIMHPQHGEVVFFLSAEDAPTFYKAMALALGVVEPALTPLPPAPHVP